MYSYLLFVGSTQWDNHQKRSTVHNNLHLIVVLIEMLVVVVFVLIVVLLVVVIVVVIVVVVPIQLDPVSEQVKVAVIRPEHLSVMTYT